MVFEWERFVDLIHRIQNYILNECDTERDNNTPTAHVTFQLLPQYPLSTLLMAAISPNFQSAFGIMSRRPEAAFNPPCMPTGDY